MSLALHWFRRDLRLDDNTALHAASRAHPQVLPVYILSRWTQNHAWTGPLRQQFLCDCLQSLDQGLRQIGSKLCIRQGDAVEELEKLLDQTQASAIYANRDPDPFGQLTEKRLLELARKRGVTLHLFKDVALHERDEVLTGAGTPFRVFTPYSRAWSKLPKPAPVGSISRLQTPEIPSLPLPTLATWELPPTSAQLPKAGEHAALSRLSHFLDTALFRYAEQRDLPGLKGTSRLSQDLRFGLISIRTVYREVEKRLLQITVEQRRSAQIFLNELCWREFYFQVLWHSPHVLEHEFAEPFRGLPWEHRPDAFQAWCAGQTGFPIVDAGMRQLQQTGFMHNRVRMIVAMFLTKDLHLDWRQGEQWFMQHLLDAEIASNNGGWQWSAGTGTDAAPYFRIQNPWTQSLRFDADGTYIRTWVPELANIPAAKLHQPPAPGLRLAPGYPLPRLDHARERDRALVIYKTHLGRA
jgi:deoxyribodipyrimidine photo-lyase